jgi:8-oxo-dGTP diphosphatase
VTVSHASHSLTASAAVLFFDAAGQALIVKPTYKEYWNLPGGAVDLDQDEDPYKTAGREVREELGIAPPIGQLLVSAWLTIPGRGAQAMYIFDGGILSPEDQAAITLQEGELNEFRFCAPGDMGTDTIPPHLTGVWHAALVARATGQCAYAPASL